MQYISTLDSDMYTWNIIIDYRLILSLQINIIYYSITFLLACCVQILCKLGDEAASGRSLIIQVTSLTIGLHMWVLWR